jgi:3-methylfumaryl-CoA hydratase
MTPIDIESLRKWIGRQETSSERIHPTAATLLAASLDAEDPRIGEGMELPPLFHWLYFLPACRQSQLGTDGHPLRGGFLPPVPLTRRMWAASTLEFAQPLLIGEQASRTSEIIDVTLKQGRSGPLLFVTVQHTIRRESGVVAVTETQELVYRDPPKAGEPAPAGPAAPSSQSWLRAVQPDPTLLFRYSALTFNAHRIHYDRRYASEVEGYPGLVIQGPLAATLLVTLLQHEVPGARLRRFRFRALKPLFDDRGFLLCGQPRAETADIRLWTCDASRSMCTEAFAIIG